MKIDNSQALFATLNQITQGNWTIQIITAKVKETGSFNIFLTLFDIFENQKIYNQTV